MSDMKTISVYSDGSAGGNAKGAIGWGWLITDWDEILGTGSGAELTGSSNMAEVHGAIDGLKFVVERGLHLTHRIELRSDSTYCLGLADGDFTPSKHLELAAELRKLAILTSCKTSWVKSHDGEIFNDQCDQLAKFARDQI